MAPAEQAAHITVHLALPGLPVSQEALPPEHSNLNGAELPQAKKKKKKKALCLCTKVHFGHVHLLQPCRLWLARLLYWGFFRQEY